MCILLIQISLSLYIYIYIYCAWRVAVIENEFGEVWISNDLV